MSTKFVPKQELVNQLRLTISKRGSGVVSIATDAQRAVVLRFLDGKLTHSNARGKGVGEALQVLAQSQTVRFSSVEARGNNRPEIMHAAEFADLIASGSTGVPTTASTGPIEESALAEAEPIFNSADKEETIKTVLYDLSAEHIGPMANLVIEQAIGSSHSLQRIVDSVAAQIPNRDAATNCRKQASEQLKQS